MELLDFFFFFFFFFYMQDLTLKHGWRTGAIIPELRKEIKIMNTEQYVHMMSWLQALTGLIEQMQVKMIERTLMYGFCFGLISLCTYLACPHPKQVHRDPASRAVVEEWIREREAMR